MATYSQEPAPVELELSEVEPLAMALFRQDLLIHATSDDPNAPETPLLDALEPCQTKPWRELTSAEIARFFAGLRFFAASCDDRRYATIAIDGQREVKLVAVEPHVRTPAPVWQEIGSGVALASDDDVRAFAAAYYRLTRLLEIPAGDIDVKRARQTIEVTARAKSIELDMTLVSDDGRVFDIGSQGVKR